MTIAGLDFVTLTRIFGDSVSVTWDRYLKADTSHPISQWTRDLAKAIGEGTDSSDRPVNPGESLAKKHCWTGPAYPRLAGLSWRR
jgi:hypothetical protein